jgi:hypothetical protein
LKVTEGEISAVGIKVFCASFHTTVDFQWILRLKENERMILDFEFLAARQIGLSSFFGFSSL